MENTNSLVKSILLLIIVFAGIGYILSEKADSDMTPKIGEQKAEQISVIALTKNTKVESTRAVLVTDRYVNTLDENDNVITIGSNGAMYNVQNGVVLADNMIIKKTNTESSNVRLHQLRNSATQNGFN
ncbi:MAG: hypothetical protein HRU03_02475 [Nanoarchaeales archaeon]|nr:hypothetical protein [Nanoarchaeales archaeon]